MSTVTTDDVRHLAVLSNLQLSDEEVEALTSDISGILDYVEQLRDVDTTGVEPTYQVSGLENVWRDDTVKDNSVSRDDLLSLAPESQDNHVKIPKVL